MIVSVLTAAASYPRHLRQSLRQHPLQSPKHLLKKQLLQLKNLQSKSRQLSQLLRQHPWWKNPWLNLHPLQSPYLSRSLNLLPLQSPHPSR